MNLGMGELAIILVIVLLLFGAGKLPKVMSDLGKGMKSFREGMKTEVDNETPPPNKKDAA